MRTIVAVLLVVLTSGAAFASKNKFLSPRSVSINFGSDRSVIFVLSDKQVVAVTAHMGKMVLRASKNICNKLHDIQFDSVMIIYGPGAKEFDPSSGVDFQFNMGPESARSSGELPSVQLVLDRDGSSAGSITRREGDTWITTDL
jgi:hypothetical protein